MPDSNYTKVFTGNFAVVQRIVMELNKIDINPVVKEQTESGLLIPVFGGSNSDYQEVFVHNDELEKAVVVIDSITSELEF